MIRILLKTILFLIKITSTIYILLLFIPIIIPLMILLKTEKFIKNKITKYSKKKEK